MFFFKKMILWSVYCGQNVRQGEMVKPSCLVFQNSLFGFVIKKILKTHLCKEDTFYFGLLMELQWLEQS